MGGLQSLLNSKEEESDNNSLFNATNEQVKNEKPVESIKLTVLGSGGGGKSTFHQQMRIIHQIGFPPTILENGPIDFRPQVYRFTVLSLVTILKEMPKLGIYFDGINETELKLDAETVLGVVQRWETEEPFSKELLDSMNRLWADKSVQRCYSRANEYQLEDSAKYFLDHTNRIGKKDYTPIEQDILRIHNPTTGVNELPFTYKDANFLVYDLGGARSERKKWIRAFEDLTAVIYCVALSEYDQVLPEDERTNRMQESLKTFDSICNNPWFTNAIFFLLLNKKDIFAQKIKTSPLTICFPDYSGGQTYDEALQYIREHFEHKFKAEDRILGKNYFWLKHVWLIHKIQEEYLSLSQMQY